MVQIQGQNVFEELADSVDKFSSTAIGVCLVGGPPLCTVFRKGPPWLKDGIHISRRLTCALSPGSHRDRKLIDGFFPWHFLKSSRIVLCWDITVFSFREYFFEYYSTQ